MLKAQAYCKYLFKQTSIMCLNMILPGLCQVLSAILAKVESPCEMQMLFHSTSVMIHPEIYKILQAAILCIGT